MADAAFYVLENYLCMTQANISKTSNNFKMNLFYSNMEL